MKHTYLFLGCLVASGCTSSAPEPASYHPMQTESQPRDLALASTSATSQPVPGYQHAASRSRFALGANVQNVSEFGMLKLVGDSGVFSTNANTGMTLATSNATSAFLAKPRLPGTADDHNAAVRNYFVSAGVPSDQILFVQPNAHMSAGGPVGTFDGSRPIAGNLEYYFSVLHRHVQGIEVVDSFAWAHMNIDGEVLGESVYWPEIPPSVVSDAVALKAIMADSAQKASFVAKLPLKFQARDGRIVIHHTPGFWDGQFSSVATYDVPESKGSFHFDVNGNRVRLAADRTASMPSSPRPANGGP